MKKLAPAVLAPPRDRSSRRSARRWRMAAAGLACLASLFLLAGEAGAPPAALVGKPLPPANVRAVIGEQQQLDPAAWRGRVVVIEMFSTYCAGCRRLAPVLAAMQREHGDRVKVLAFSHEPRSVLRRMLEQRPPLGFAVGQCTGRTALLYGATALPTLIVADQRGIVRLATQGSNQATVQLLREAVRRLLAD